MKKYSLIIFFIYFALASVFHALALPDNSLPVGGWLTTCESSGETNIKVSTVIPGGFLDNAGILPEDIITWCDNTKLSTVTNNVKDWLKKYLAEIKTGQNITLIAQRTDIQLTTTVQRVSSRPLKFLPDIAGSAPTDVARALSLWSNDAALVEATAISGLVRSCQIRQDAWHSELIDHVMQHPVDLHACAAAQAEECIDIAGATNFPMLMPQGKRSLRNPAFAGRAPPLHAESNSLKFGTNGILDLLVSDVNRAGEYVQNAFTELSSQEICDIVSQLDDILYGIDTFFYINDDTNKQRYAKSHAVIKSALKVDFKKLDMAAAILSAWGTPKMYIPLLNECMQISPETNITSEGCAGKLIAIRKTRWGNIVIGGMGNNTYDDSPAVVIDIGGRDKYKNVSAHGMDKPVSMIIDASGDDTYIATNGPAIAAAVAGAACLFDLKGDDYYSCPKWGNGAGYFGSALLVDFEGNDRYLGESFSQGVALFGSGNLIDLEGNDTFLAKRFSQGLGLSGGKAVLCDIKGNDFYVATLGKQSMYGTPGVYSSFSQGAGVGFRLISAGGVGMLVDSEGNDRYESGNFSQAVGYYLGTGILYNGTGDDEYNGSRYTQAAAAHTAAAALIDMGGNDCYRGKITANQGIAWDKSVVSFFDKSGNDNYNSFGLALAAACGGSWASFNDNAGNDNYIFSPCSSCGYVRTTTTNISVFCDTGGSDDVYNSGNINSVSNNTNFFKGILGVFMDD